MAGTIDEAFVEIIPRVDTGDFERRTRSAFKQVEGTARRSGTEIERAFQKAGDGAGRQLAQVDDRSRAAFAKVEGEARGAATGVETQFSRAGEGAERSMREVGDSGRHFRKIDAEAKRTADKTEGHFKRAGSSIKSLFLSIGTTLAGIGIARTFAGFIQGASGLNEIRNQIEVTFGKRMQGQLQRFGATAATSLGLGQRAALNMAVQFGDLFRTTGSSGAEAAKLSQRFVRLAGDLASFKNARPEEVFEALRSGLIGEAEPLRRFGVLLSEARVQTEALRITGKKNAKDLTEQEKVLARYNLILHDSRRATGDYKKTQDELANAQRTSQGLWQNLGDTIGAAFLPVAKDVFEVLNKEVLPAMISFAKQEGPGVAASISGIVKSLSTVNFGDIFATVAEGARTFKANLDGAGVSAEGFIGFMATLGNIAREAVAGIKEFASGAQESSTGVSNLKTAGEGIADTFSVAGTVIGFFADHIDIIAQNMPLLIGAFIAYKAAQAAANAATIVQVSLLPLQIAGTVILANANRRLAVANTQLAVATAGTNAATLAGVGVQNITALSVIRSTVAWVAQKAALVAARAATIAYTAVQWLLNAALTANPIGIVIALIVALVAAVVIAYKKSETFRNIVNAAFRAILSAGKALVGGLVDGFNKVKQIFGVVASFVAAAARSGFLGPVPFIIARWREVVSFFSTLPSRIIGFIRTIPDRIKGLFASAGTFLFNAGVNIISGLINGIKSRIAAVASTISSVASTIRNALPFSPAKYGPLSGSGSPDKAGRKIGVMLATGMRSSERFVEEQAARLAGKTMALDPLRSRQAAALLASTGTPRGFSVENLNVTTVGDRFRLDDILTELRLQGVR